MAPQGKTKAATPRVNLSQHLATIESYLEDYRASDTDRTVNQDHFQKYILTSCWAKMSARAEHWISIGMINYICDMSEYVLITAAIDLEGTPVSADRALRAFLQSGCIREILKYHKDCMKGIFDKQEKDVISVDPIVNACGEDYTYTVEIAVAFHGLLVSSLLSYMFCL